MDSLIKWRGGKSRLAKKIVSLFPKHICYVEAFGGAAWVLFAKNPKTSKHEILNDAHGELMNFWEIVRTKPDELFKSMQWDIPSRLIYNQLRKTDLSRMSNVERARRLYWMIKSAFGSTYADVFGTARESPNRANFDSFEKRLKEVNNRLKRVTVECKDYNQLSKIYDHETTLWYCDPPYLGTIKTGYAADIDLGEFETFAKSLKGKVAISHNVNDQIKEAFKDWNFIDLGRRQNCIGNNGKSAGTHAFEWLITNYDPPKEIESAKTA